MCSCPQTNDDRENAIAADDQPRENLRARSRANRARKAFRFKISVPVTMAGLQGATRIAPCGAAKGGCGS